MREALIFGAVALHHPPSHYKVQTVKRSDATFKHTIFNLRDKTEEPIKGLTTEIKPSSLSLHTPKEMESFKQNPVFVEHCKVLLNEKCLFQRYFMPHITQHIHLEPTSVITSIIEVQTYSIETTKQEDGFFYSEVVINDGFDVRLKRVYRHDNAQHLVEAHVEAVSKANECFPLLKSVAVDTGLASSLRTISEENFDLVIKGIKDVITNDNPPNTFSHPLAPPGTPSHPLAASLRIVRRSNSGKEEPFSQRESFLKRQFERLTKETGGTQTPQSLPELLRNYPWKGTPNSTLNKRREQSMLISSALEEIESDDLDDLKLQLNYLLTRTKG